MRGKRWRLLACGGVLAALIVVAVPTVSAAAVVVEEPTGWRWFECVKASPKNTGSFQGNNCAGSSGSGIKYTLREGLAQGRPFRGKVKGTKNRPILIEIDNPLAQTAIECKSGSDTGEYGLPAEFRNIALTLTKCAVGAQPCTSPAAASGETQLAPLRGEIGRSSRWVSVEEFEKHYVLGNRPELGVKLAKRERPRWDDSRIQLR